jgi:cytochrome c peroxidase
MPELPAALQSYAHRGDSMKPSTKGLAIAGGLAIVVALIAGTDLSKDAFDGAASGGSAWTAEERAVLATLSLSGLDPVPPDPSNRYADDAAASRFGSKLFFDTRLSSNGLVACATCHAPEKGFQDGVPLGRGVGVAGRRTMPIAGTAHSPWQFWDGRADSQWEQALGPLESAVEHGGDRLQYAHLIRAQYGQEYESVFGALPDLKGLPDRAGPVDDTIRARAWATIPPMRQEEISRVYANLGKAIAAFERRITFTPSRFDRFVDAELSGRQAQSAAFTPDERAGLRLFIGKAHCVSCHNGPLFTDDYFHNTGVPRPTADRSNDDGRASGVRAAMANEFSCLGRFSDASASDCGELRFAVKEGAELERAFKTPSLRNAAVRAPFMHAGQLTSVDAVLSHYNRAPSAPAGRSELEPLRLSASELRQLAAFLETLVSPVEFPRSSH